MTDFIEKKMGEFREKFTYVSGDDGKRYLIDILSEDQEAFLKTALQEAQAEIIKQIEADVIGKDDIGWGNEPDYRDIVVRNDLRHKNI